MNKDVKRPLSRMSGNYYQRRSAAYVEAVSGLLLPPRAIFPSPMNDYNYEFPGDYSYLRYRGVN